MMVPAVANAPVQRVQKPPVLVDPPAPVPKLQRPVLLIAGGSSKPNGLPEVSHYLTHGGSNQFAGVYGVDDRAGFEQQYRAKGGNVFTLRYSKPFASFEHNAQEIKTAIADLQRLTGAAEIDVVAECKGAMEMRQYLKEGNDGVRNLVMLVPPNHGLPVGGDLARMVATLVKRLHVPIKSFSGYPVDNDSFKALSSFSTDWKLGPLQGNSVVRSFNTPESIANESKVLNSLTVVAGEGDNLLSQQLGPGLPFPLMRGDHSVPNWSAYLPHATNFFFDGERSIHGQVKSHPEALAKVAETLTTDGKPVHDESYLASAPTVGRVMTRSVAWTAGFIGRLNVASHAWSGTAVGPVGVVLGGVGAGLAVLDGGRQLASALRGDAHQGTAKALVGSVGKLAQAAGVIGGMAGVGGWVSAALIGGGLLASTLTA